MGSPIRRPTLGYVALNAEDVGQLRAVASIVAHWSFLLPLAALVLIFSIDALFWRYSIPLLLGGLLDEPAHLATVALVLAALPRTLPHPFVVGSLLGSVILDVDHLPLVFSGQLWPPVDGRPYTHSLFAAVVVGLVLYRLLPERVTFVFGLVCGLLGHLGRDLVTGLVPLFWPVTTHQISVPYAFYAVAIGATAGLATWREIAHRRHQAARAAPSPTPAARAE